MARAARGSALALASASARGECAPQKAKALATLDELAAPRDGQVSALATWSRDNRPSKETLAGVLVPFPR